MRITGLELAPYGHLAYARLELPSPPGGPGLHVIRGRNGAGKSTTMRALDGALFGISRRTHDTHTHPGPALRIGLSLETPDGRVLRLERRKRDGQSLFDADGSPVDEAVLREALGGLPPEEFRAMFLLDCEKLEAGSEDLLAGRGLLGQALFGAALGFGRVHTVLAELDEEAQALWVKRGTRAMTQQIKLLTEARRERRQKRFDPDELARLQRELDETERQLAELKETQSVLAGRLERTSRHQRCLSPLARRMQLLEELKELPPTPQLPACFVDDVCAAEADLEAADELIAETADDLDRVDAELAANPEPGPIADREGAINALYQRAGESAKAASDLPRREAELTTRSDDLRRLLARAGLPLETDRPDECRISDADHAWLAELASDRAALDQARADAKQVVARLKRQITELDANKPPAPVLGAIAQEALGEAIDAARDAGDLDGLVATAQRAAADYLEEAQRGCAALARWAGDVDALRRLAVPKLATVQHFEREYAELERAEARLEDRERELDARAEALDHEAESLAAGPNAPTRSQVAAAREHRDEAVTALIAAPAGERAAVARARIRSADQLADARADHAEDAAARDRLERDRAGLQKARAQLEQDRSAHALTEGQVAQRWTAQWPGLADDPLAPSDMREWLAARVEVLAAERAAREQRAAAARAQRSIDDHRATLCGFLGVDTAAAQSCPLKQLLRQAKSLLSEVSAARATAIQSERDRARLRDELAEAGDRVTEAEDKLRTWAEEWVPLVEGLGLAADASPAQARAQLAVIDELVGAFDGVTALKHRVERLREDEADFACDAVALAAEIAPDLVDENPLCIADELHARAAAARTVRAARRQLEPQRRALAHKATTAAAKRKGATERLDALAQRADVGVEALGTLCETIERRNALADELRSVESELVAAGMASIAELTAELAHATPESLATARAADEAEAAELEARRTELDRQAGALREKLDGCGGDAAAVAAEQEAHARAAVLDGYERYTELAFAAALLRAAVERHRKQNEGPLLRRASELFARLSAGTMSGLTVVTSERDPYIMGVLPDKREVPVGGMSAGQRHQLFLALRLASLERHFEHNEPMPLILDDLLVQLDDVSARAALEVLAELSRTAQVLCFTHHDHLVAMARDTVPSNLLLEHEIGETTRPALKAA
jgi:uncharacterized protein YhaN